MSLYNHVVRSPRFRQLVSVGVLVALLMTTLLPTPQLALADFGYTVKSGDTLSKIAKNNSTTVEAIVAANKTKFPCLATNPACLQVGWVITIPGAGGTASNTATGPSTYTVQSGDSLSKIAKKLGVDFNALIAANKKARPCLAAASPCGLQIGWVLNIPGGSGGAAPVASDNPAATIAEYIAAINARDVNRFKATIHPDLLRNTPEADEEIRALFLILDALKIKIEITDLRVIERGNEIAIVAYTFKATSSLFDAQDEESASGQFLLLKYQGQWKIVADNFDDLQEPIQ